MNIMKKLLFLLLSVFTLQVAQADNDKPITFDKLPAKAQTFIKQNFPTEKVAFTKMEKGFLDTSYDVVFVNGNGVEFDKNGRPIKDTAKQDKLKFDKPKSDKSKGDKPKQ